LYKNYLKKEGIQKCLEKTTKKETTSRRKEKSSPKMSEEATDNKFFPSEGTFWLRETTSNKPIKQQAQRKTSF